MHNTLYFSVFAESICWLPRLSNPFLQPNHKPYPKPNWYIPRYHISPKHDFWTYNNNSPHWVQALGPTRSSQSPWHTIFQKMGPTMWQIQEHTHTLQRAVRLSSQRGASCMHARVCEVWLCLSLVHTVFCICHNPLSATLSQADNSREDRQPNPLHSELGRPAYKQHVLHTCVRTHRLSHTNTHTLLCFNVMKHRKHTCPTEMLGTHTFSRLPSKSSDGVLKDTAF